MLPSTGYFKGINCPFYDNGLCDRPYCHFRHVKKETQGTASVSIESGAILQKLVSAAVQKVLQQTEAGVAATSQRIVPDSLVDSNNITIVPVITKATYNPTPISELNKINNTDTENNDESNEQRKRHIPVPYTPRKPASLPIKRPVEINGDSQPFIYIHPPVKYTPGSTENIQCDKYTPVGLVESTEKYLPGVEKELQEYTPDENGQHSSKVNYIPSDKTVSKKKILEYKPIKVNTKSEIPSVSYQPTPKFLAPCFSSDEDEPELKKRKLSNDLNGLDELGAEFDILDQILDEEKTEKDNKSTEKVKKHKNNHSDKKVDSSNKHSDKKVNNSSNHSDKKVNSSKSTKENQNNANEHKKDKTETPKSRKKNQNDKEKSSSDKEKHESKSKSSDKKSSHRSKDRDKDKDRETSKDRKEKHSSEEKKHRSKSSDRSPKHSSKHKSSRKDHKHSDCKSSKSSSKKSKYDNKKPHKHSKDSKEKIKTVEKRNTSKELPNDYDIGHSDQLEEDDYLSEADEETIASECKRIFEEYEPLQNEKVEEEPTKVEDAAVDEYIPGKKRISRTNDKNVKVVPKTPIKPDFKVSAAQIMSERLSRVRDYHHSKNTIPTPSSDIPPMKPELHKSAPNIGSSKIRIAHVPNVSTLLNARKIISPHQTVVTTEASTSSTISQTIKKGAQRVAHVPSDKFIDRPGVLEPLGSKIPANIRSTYLNMMIDQCLKLYISTTDAYARAQNEELTTSKKCSTIAIYKNSAVLAVSRLRKELQESNGVKKLLEKNTDSACKSNSLGSWSIESKNRKTINSIEFQGARFYQNIEKWVLSEEQLKENGFPRPHTTGEKGRAIIYGQNKQIPPKGYIRTCRRCKKEFTVDKKGFPTVKEECIYHPNNKYRVRGEARYQCCSQDASSDGCCIAPNHVYEYVDFDNLKGFVKTLPPAREMDDYGVYSLDCEMCYTTHGLDLTRVTVINSSCKVVYETLIRPLHPIVDYNTRYSGITEEHMAKVKTTLLDVQATLLTMFNSKTILIGHSLESDFKALKLIHDTVIDTSVLFPHKMGPPYKRALRNLSSEHLKKIIQNSVDGHDSAEDAMVCMELLHYKLKEELKTR